jgi:hypothetical protein
MGRGMENYLDVGVFFLLISVVMGLGKIRKDLVRIHHELIEIRKKLSKE